MAYQGVDFEDQEPATRRPQEDVGGLPGRIIKYGWAKDKRQANVVLLGITITAIVLAIIISTIGGDGSFSEEVIDPDADLNSQVQ